MISSEKLCHNYVELISNEKTTASEVPHKTTEITNPCVSMVQINDLHLSPAYLRLRELIFMREVIPISGTIAALVSGFA